MKFSKSLVVFLITLLSLSVIVPVVITIDYPDKPINITSDEDFETYGFLGAGTEQDPYLIENLKITKRKEDYTTPAIRVIFTTKHFIVRNCVIKNYGFGIRLYDNGNITIQIANNYIEDCEWNGISCYDGGRAVITGNTIINCDFGIYVARCNNSVVENNQLFHNSKGFRIDNSPYTLIASNNVSKNTNWGGIVYKSDYSKILDNNFDNQSLWEFDYYFTYLAGLDISHSNFLEVSNNACLNISGTCLYIENVHYSNFTFNNISFSSKLSGMLIEDSNNNFFWMNSFQQNYGKGMAFVNSSYNVIHHNAFLDNGLSIERNASENSCTDNIWYDLILSEGNFWLNWDTVNPFIIEGQGSVDWFPLDYNPIT